MINPAVSLKQGKGIKAAPSSISNQKPGQEHQQNGALQGLRARDLRPCLQLRGMLRSECGLSLQADGVIRRPWDLSEVRPHWRQWAAGGVGVFGGCPALLPTDLTAKVTQPPFSSSQLVPACHQNRLLP